MKLDTRRIAPYGLMLALAALVAAAGLYFFRHQFDLYIQICLALIVIGLAASILLDPEKARQTLTGRQARYGSNAFIMSVAFIGILVVANFLAQKYSPRWDLTQDKQHTLSKESIDTLNTLKEPVFADAIFSTQMPSDTAKALLDSYKSASNGKFDYKLIDPNKDPVTVQNDKVSRDGTIVLKMGDRQEQVTSSTEQDISSALVKLANPGKRTVYFLSGHGEFDPDGTGDTSYSQVKTILTNKNYTITKLNLLNDPKIPEDALAIVIARPLKPLLDSEVALLKAYQNKGGSLVVLYDSSLFLQFGDQKDPLASYLESDWGVKLDDDILVDYNPLTQQMGVDAFASSYAEHPITQKLQNMAAVFPTARTITLTKPAAGDVDQIDLIKTSPQSWGETDLANVGKTTASPDQGKDVIGPANVAVAATNTTTNARLIVVGDGDFATDQYFGSFANGDFIINSIDWAAAQDNLINLTPKSTTQRTMMMPSQPYVMPLILLVTIFVMPGIVLVSGISTWASRKRRS